MYANSYDNACQLNQAYQPYPSSPLKQWIKFTLFAGLYHRSRRYVRSFTTHCPRCTPPQPAGRGSRAQVRGAWQRVMYCTLQAMLVSMSVSQSASTNVTAATGGTNSVKTFQTPRKHNVILSCFIILQNLTV